LSVPESRGVPAAVPAVPARAPRRAGAFALVRPAPEAPAAELWAALHLPKITHARQLLQLGELAQRFTPRVSLEPPDGLLLEVRGSLHLFAGIAGLRAALAQLCGQLALEVRVAFAPTPWAALVAARAGRQIEVSSRTQLIGELATLPLSALRWPPQLLQRLKQAGVRTIGAALRLPRAGFARRFGSAQLAALDQLAGRTRELRAVFKPPEHYRRGCELSCETDSHAAILSALTGLLEELEDFLRGRGAGVMQIECRLLHRHAPWSSCVLLLAAPAAAARHIGGLFAEKLSRLELPQPVRALSLRPGVLLPLTPQAHGLWQPGEYGGTAGAGEAHSLIERLRARLGEGAIHGLTLRDDHRPEHSWALGAPPPARAGVREALATGLPARRPLWLLGLPQPLTVHAGLPQRRGPLKLLSEPERIESGWWDGADIARDYYTALDARGVRLWVFRERAAPHGWFLHGIFG
jgi:protein ImuB